MHLNSFVATLIASAAFMLSGCGKKPNAVTQSAPANIASGEASTVSTPAESGPSAAASPAASAEPDLGALTQALRKYSAEKQQVPQSFDEVIAAGYVTPAPTPPPGKKFDINRKRLEVILVNR